MEINNDKMESSIFRDQNFAVNSDRMTDCKRHFKTSLSFGVAGNLALMYLSICLFSFHIGRSIGSVIGAHRMMAFFEATSDEIKIQNLNLSATLIMIPLSFVGILVSILSNRYYYKASGIIQYIVYVLFMLIAVGSFFGIYDDMSYRFGIIIFLYAVFGIWMSDFSYRSLKELDYLSTQEGFPSFNLAMHYMGRSTYVRLREKYLGREKKYEVYTDRIKPVSAEKVKITENDDSMDGIETAGEGVREEWFEENRTMTEENSKQRREDNAMEDLSTDDMFYIDEDKERERLERIRKSLD